MENVQRFTSMFYKEMNSRIGQFLYGMEVGKQDVAMYISDVEKADDDNVVMYAVYWLKYLHLPIKKGNATAGWSRKNNSSGVVVTFDIHFEKDEYSGLIATVDVFYHGLVGKTCFSINEEGVEYLSEDVEESEESFYNREETTNPYINSETHLSSNTLHSAICCASETIMKGLSIVNDKILSN